MINDLAVFTSALMNSAPGLKILDEHTREQELPCNFVATGIGSGVSRYSVTFYYEFDELAEPLIIKNYALLGIAKITQETTKRTSTIQDAVYYFFAETSRIGRSIESERLRYIFYSNNGVVFVAIAESIACN